MEKEKLCEKGCGRHATPGARYCYGMYCIHTCFKCGVSLPEEASTWSVQKINNIMRGRYCGSGGAFCSKQTSSTPLNLAVVLTPQQQPVDSRSDRDPKRPMPVLPLAQGTGICVDLGKQEAQKYLLLTVPQVKLVPLQLTSSASTLQSLAEHLLKQSTNFKSLSALYAAFCDDKELKGLVGSVIKSHLSLLHQRYKSVKAELRTQFGLVQEDAEPSSGKPKTWSAKVKRLGVSDEQRADWARKYASSSHPPLTNVDVGVIHLPDNADWFSAMVALSLIRKHLVAGNITKYKRVQHLTVLDFADGFCLFALNSRHEGAGTTRMLWPMTRSLEDAETYTPKAKAYTPEKEKESIPYLRVLDLSYGEVYQWLRLLLDQGKWSDADLAKAMLGIIQGHGHQEQVQRLRMAPPTSIGYPKCSFLYGWTVNSQGLALAQSEWYLSKKSRRAKNLTSTQVSQYEVVCYILSILFLAEPRHALGMWHATERALELVADKRLSFAQLFSNLEGHIKHGRLLPGANVLGGALSKEVKRLAMPLVDGVLRALGTEDSNLAVTHNTQAAMNAEPKRYYGSRNQSPSIAATEVVYQPLMKVLFLELLDLLVKKHQNLTWTQGQAEHEAIIDGEQDEEGLGDILHKD